MAGIERDQPWTWWAAGLILGVAIGVGVGAAMHDIGVGIAIGAGIGVALAIAFGEAAKDVRRRRRGSPPGG